MTGAIFDIPTRVETNVSLPSGLPSREYKPYEGH
jgi:hypothetical protein